MIHKYIINFLHALKEEKQPTTNVVNIFKKVKTINLRV